MNYIKHYNLLIESRKQLNRGLIRQIGYEIHHIHAKCLGGSNNVENLLLLTTREHYIAHWLLWKATNDFRLGIAFGTMCWNKEKRKFTSGQLS